MDLAVRMAHAMDPFNNLLDLRRIRGKWYRNVHPFKGYRVAFRQQQFHKFILFIWTCKEFDSNLFTWIKCDAIQPVILWQKTRTAWHRTRCLLKISKKMLADRTCLEETMLMFAILEESTRPSSQHECMWYSMCIGTHYCFGFGLIKFLISYVIQTFLHGTYIDYTNYCESAPSSHSPPLCRLDQPYCICF